MNEGDGTDSGDDENGANGSGKSGNWGLFNLFGLLGSAGDYYLTQLQSLPNSTGPNALLCTQLTFNYPNSTRPCPLLT